VSRRPRLLPVLLVLALSACSGSGQQEDARQAFVERASEICTEADEQFHALPQPTTPEQFGPYVDQTMTIAEQAQAELSALTLPEQDRAELERKVLEPFATLVQDGRAFAERVAAAGTDQSALLALLSERPTSAGIDKEFLTSYDLPACADAISQVG
jgi:glucose/arabinose dehydrogenase